MVDGSNSVDKKMPPGFLVVDGSAAALFPPLMEKREMCFLQMVVLLHDHEEKTAAVLMLASAVELHGGFGCLEVSPLAASYVTMMAASFSARSRPVANCLYVIT